jgi:hypothetical protein
MALFYGAYSFLQRKRFRFFKVHFADLECSRRGSGRFFGLLSPFRIDCHTSVTEKTMSPFFLAASHLPMEEKS